LAEIDYLLLLSDLFLSPPMWGLYVTWH